MRPWIAGNWKMNGLSSQLGEIQAIATSVMAAPSRADVLIYVPATLLGRAARIAAGRIGIGGEDCDSEIFGAFAGDIGAEMLKDAGACAVIVGHSERRQHHGETNAMVAAKAKAVWRAGLLTLICIGGTESQSKGGNALSVCADQIAGSVPDGVALAANALAYEPRWAIGTGHTPTPEQIVQMHAHIRQCLVLRWDAAANHVRILFGGSVEPGNARAIPALPEVGGALIGGASLKATEFEAIVGAVSVTA